VECQLDYLANCPTAGIRDALNTLPATLDETYERTLREIKDTRWKFARHLLLCVAVTSRPLRVEELAEILAFDFEAGPIPKFHGEWRLKNPVEAVLSTCPSLLSLVNADDSPVIQFTHSSVKEFLMSVRFAEKRNTISHRYHVSLAPAHTLVAQACLGILLHLDENITRDSLSKFPLAEYAAEHWIDHTLFEAVSQNVDEGMKQLFDQSKPHLAVWLWIHDPTLPFWRRDKSAKRPLPLHGTPLHYAAFCGLHDVVKVLAIGRSQDLNSLNFDDNSTPLHLASREGHVEVAQFLVEHGAEVAAEDKYSRTPLHVASDRGHVELSRLLVKYGADAAAQDKYMRTPLHVASDRGHEELARFLFEHLAARTKGGQTPVHRASDHAQVDASAAHVVQDIMLSLSQNRLAPLPSSPPGQSTVRWICTEAYVCGNVILTLA
jgi:Ankyrin repeats (3 copies)/Ankyrin repeats (many copies)